ncbi:MptD family putative ECF transporter S component [Desulfurispira natronophila]|uniref:Energy-coupling factor transport system substrate-specific component n=1 Tax=Desulfurispira natronophila TaxID=682562 RepID=A0A7W8DGM7_9BACT|nr:MptD family putative ECF transporter S component [Desulfurispira natronophila]MBB5021539.1 energy-coupling factor transport system substrate-specific component [Desulfurispira natronophila]
MSSAQILTLNRYWQVPDLVVVGIFAAVVKVSSILVALMGGGMNPLTLILKNVIFTALLVVLLYKVRKFGTLTLFLVVSAIISALMLGGSLVLIPASILAGLIAEGVIMALGGYRFTWSIMVGVAIYDLLSKSIGLGFSWLMMREEPRIIIMATIIVAIGYIGSIIGLFVGRYFVKELRHAGIIRH